MTPFFSQVHRHQRQPGSLSFNKDASLQMNDLTFKHDNYTDNYDQVNN